VVGSAGLLQQWYFYGGLAAATLTVIALGSEHVRRGFKWLGAKMVITSVTQSVEPVNHRLTDLEDELDSQDDRLDRIETMVQSILYEVKPNGGGSMKDAVNTLVKNQATIAEDVDRLKQDFAEHRGYHEGLHER